MRDMGEMNPFDHGRLCAGIPHLDHDDAVMDDYFVHDGPNDDGPFNEDQN